MNAEPLRDRSHLENSRQLRWDWTCENSSWEALLDRTLDLLQASEGRRRARRSGDQQRLRFTLGAMLLDLYAASTDSPAQWVAYSRNRNDYGTGKPYVPAQVTFTAATAAADFLTRSQLAEHRSGSFDRNANPFGGQGRGFRSRLRARAAILELFAEFGLSRADLRQSDVGPALVLKAGARDRDGPKRLLPFSPTTDTRKMQEQLNELNAFVAEFDVDLPEAAVQDRSTRLRRVFNNGRFDHGGRFYGGWWQSLSKQDRARLTIDGEPTVELDFKALHPRLCYHLSGKPLPLDVDPYALKGMEGERRDVVKRAFNRLLNIAAGGTLRAPSGVPSLLPKGLRYRELVERLEAKHDFIRPWFRSGRGVELQRIDSDIASSILSYLRFRGVCCLPVHDSFIVPVSAEFTLGQTMALAYQAQLTRFTEVRAYPAIAGWSSVEVETRVFDTLTKADVRTFALAARPTGTSGHY